MRFSATYVFLFCLVAAVAVSAHHEQGVSRASSYKNDDISTGRDHVLERDEDQITGHSHYAVVLSETFVIVKSVIL